MIKNIDEVYPDFNKKSTHSIARIDVLNVYESKNIESYLNLFVSNIYGDKVKPNTTFYILRKDN